MKKILLTSLILSTIGTSAFATMSTVESDNLSEQQLLSLKGSTTITGSVYVVKLPLPNYMPELPYEGKESGIKIRKIANTLNISCPEGYVVPNSLKSLADGQRVLMRIEGDGHEEVVEIAIDGQSEIREYKGEFGRSFTNLLFENNFYYPGSDHNATSFACVKKEDADGWYIYHSDF